MKNTHRNVECHLCRCCLRRAGHPCGCDGGTTNPQACGGVSVHHQGVGARQLLPTPECTAVNPAAPMLVEADLASLKREIKRCRQGFLSVAAAKRRHRERRRPSVATAASAERRRRHGRIGPVVAAVEERRRNNGGGER